MKKGSKHTAATRARIAAGATKDQARRHAGLPLEVEHGTVSAYSNAKCRCPECRATWASYMKILREAVASDIERVEGSS